MKNIELIAPCHFGLEAVLKREIQDLGYEIAKVEDGRVTFFSDLGGIARAHVFEDCRTDPAQGWCLSRIDLRAAV